jgi:hypothetical protein
MLVNCMPVYEQLPTWCCDQNLNSTLPSQWIIVRSSCFLYINWTDHLVSYWIVKHHACWNATQFSCSHWCSCCSLLLFVLQGWRRRLLLCCQGVSRWCTPGYQYSNLIPIQQDFTLQFRSYQTFPTRIRRIFNSVVEHQVDLNISNNKIHECIEIQRKEDMDVSTPSIGQFVCFSHSVTEKKDKFVLDTYCCITSDCDSTREAMSQLPTRSTRGNKKWTKHSTYVHNRQSLSGYQQLQSFLSSGSIIDFQWPCQSIQEGGFDLPCWWRWW